MAIRLDPSRGGVALLIGAVHGECRYQPLPVKPPNAEAGARYIAAYDYFPASAGIAPEFVGKIEHIGEEVGYVDEWSRSPNNAPPQCFPQ